MRFNVPLPRNTKKFGQEFSYIPTRSRCHCQEFTKKHYNVVIRDVILGLIFLAILNNSTVIEMYDDKLLISYGF